MLSLDFSVHIAQAEEVVFYTLEDSAKQIKYKILAKLSVIHSDIIKTGKYSELEKNHIQKCIDKAKSLKIEIVDGLTDINDITADINHKMLKKYRRFIVVDYAQKLQDREIKGYSKHEVITSASDKIHKACIKYDTHIMCPAQFGRDVEKTREEPMLSDFKECGSLEQDGMLIFLAWVKEKDGKDIMLKCAKNKTSGKYFKNELYWNTSRFGFTDHQNNFCKDDRLYQRELK
jgi:replicative DNA helicase